MYGLFICAYISYVRIQHESSYKIHLKVKEGDKRAGKRKCVETGGEEVNSHWSVHCTISRAVLLRKGKRQKTWEGGGREGKEVGRPIFTWNCTKHVSTHEHTHTSHTTHEVLCYFVRIWYPIENVICNSHSTNENTVDFMCVVHVCKQTHKLTLCHTDLFE